MQTLISGSSRQTHQWLINIHWDSSTNKVQSNLAKGEVARTSVFLTPILGEGEMMGGVMVPLERVMVVL